MTFTYKTHIFGGTELGNLGPINPFLAPITKISAEVHAVPYLNPDDGNIPYNQTGTLEGSKSDINHHEMEIGNYLNKLDTGEIIYPEYEMIDWILDYVRNEDGELVPATDPNKPFAYKVQNGDGLTYVNPRHRLYDQEVETNYTNVKTLQSQNYQQQWGMPYKPIETRPWGDLDVPVTSPTEEQLQEQNPMGADDYTEV